jgi:hypothetical protein
VTTVAHWNDRPSSGWAYIGRKGGGLFGNPFTAERHGRDRAIALFRVYFHNRLERDESFRAAVLALRGKVLVCHCKPLACHGDVIAEYLNSL